jgi:hypothetical protein
LSSTLVPLIVTLIVLFLYSHQGPDSGSKLSQDEFDKRAKRNVERWISAHIVPVRGPGYIAFRSILNSPQEYPLTFDSNPHETLLKGKSISFVSVGKGDPEWKDIVVDNQCRIIKKKEVSQGSPFQRVQLITL